MGLIFEVAAHGLTAILATWLGLLVVTRARRAHGAPVFGLLALLLVVWSVAIIAQRMGTVPEVKDGLNAFEDVAAFPLPAVTAHLAISVALEGRPSRIATAFLLAAYAIGVGAAFQAVADPAHPIVTTPPHWEPFGIPGEVLGWGFIAVRAVMFAGAIGWLVGALRRAGDDVPRQRQLKVMLLTLGIGVVGGMMRILPEEVGGPAWIGVSLIALATVLAVYAVLAQRVFIGAEVTAREFRASLVVGLGVVGYVLVLVAADRAVSALIGLELPIVIALAVVVTLALFEPIAEAVRRVLSGPSAIEPLALAPAVAGVEGQPAGTRGHELLRPALSRLVRTFDLTGAAVVDNRGQPTMVHGRLDPSDDPHARLPLEAADGHAAFGLKRSGLPLRPAELDLLRMATTYVDAAIRLGERTGAHETALRELSREGRAVEAHEAALAEALAVHASGRRGLYVYALGPLRAELDGEPMRRWGGPKAGSRQAEAVFAFLFDRGERGASKDEIVELVWPDVDLDRADTAFHRTMLGLRSALAPARKRGRADGPIEFGNDRYRLRPDVVTWSDVAEFESLLQRARGSAPDERLLLLEAARTLYRSELFDDCPFYGDSVYVEERREELRERYVDLLIDLGALYEERGDRAAAADASRRARAITGRDPDVIASRTA
ncbi:MAG TPA: hypothetical protein VM253_09535 [Candidatus Limnocylindrales bacterium]|nr:hypothetical protein [Candidatus Limnocylindrales bacterium]